MAKIVTLFKLLARRDTMSRLLILREMGKWVLPQYRFKWPQIAWWEDAEFNAYLSRFNELDGLNTDRRWMQAQLMRLVTAVPGDSAECGVYEGAGSYLMCAINARQASPPRMHHVFDSFEGLSAPSAKDGTFWTEGDMSRGMDLVTRNLSEFRHFELHKGWIPERFPDVADSRFAFVHIDVDLHQPTWDSMVFFYPRMSQGGIILCDDYGFTSCPGATEAIDTFLEDKPERMLALPCGGGFLIRGCETSGK